ncbi:helix-turn-helix domain-containing protein [Secundilactobacillus collinoides]|uniref:helix-turn-helix domain-containing protein n=1 Tax=Secundilactobacillus collinoides TaxID=33960 RepID=UPI0007AE5D41|nr:helix-turn-helix transcriptional regulator [Secundilactobacillus collinoides]
MQATKFRISLKAARINAGFSQEQAAEWIGHYFGTRVSRQRVSYLEANPDDIAPGYGKAFAELYQVPIDMINFVPKSTLSYTIGDKELFE